VTQSEAMDRFYQETLVAGDPKGALTHWFEFNRWWARVRRQERALKKKESESVKWLK
jgi:hypothetical protein